MKTPESKLADLTANLRNSLLGPPTSTAPSLVPTLSANLTEILLPGENFFLDIWRHVSDQIALLRTFICDECSRFSCPCSSWSISGSVAVLLLKFKIIRIINRSKVYCSTCGKTQFPQGAACSRLSDNGDGAWAKGMQINLSLSQFRRPKSQEQARQAGRREVIRKLNWSCTVDSGNRHYLLQNRKSNRHAILCKLGVNKKPRKIAESRLTAYKLKELSSSSNICSIEPGIG